MIGKRTREALYVHSSAWMTLPENVRRRIGAALSKLFVYICTNSIAWFGKHANVEDALLDNCRDFITKLPHKSTRVSFLYYPYFDTEAHPALAKAFLVSGKRVTVTDYTRRTNPPILHRKEEFVAEGYRLYEQFKAITQQEETCGLYAKRTLNTIGTRKGWDKLVARLPVLSQAKLLTLPGTGVNVALSPAHYAALLCEYAVSQDKCDRKVILKLADVVAKGNKKAALTEAYWADTFVREGIPAAVWNWLDP